MRSITGTWPNLESDDSIGDVSLPLLEWEPLFTLEWELEDENREYCGMQLFHPCPDIAFVLLLGTEGEMAGCLPTNSLPISTFS